MIFHITTFCILPLFFYYLVRYYKKYKISFLEHVYWSFLAAGGVAIYPIIAYSIIYLLFLS